MKRILIALAIIGSVQFADAQTKSPAEAKKAVETAEAAAANPKKAAKVATWTKLAESYLNAYDAPAGSVVTGASKQELQFMMGNEKPVSSEQTELGGQPVIKEVYENKDLYFNANGQLILVDVTKPVFADDVLAKALDAYKKAAEVDVKNTKVKDLTAGLEAISSRYLQQISVR